MNNIVVRLLDNGIELWIGTNMYVLSLEEAESLSNDLSVLVMMLAQKQMMENVT